MKIDVILLNQEKVLFEGKASSIIVPGEQGVFEILPFHKQIISRIISGTLKIDDKDFYVLRGAIRANNNRATLIIE
ncbi:MAG: hypothetical protein ABH843_00355 [Candidatus Omnitrophota bacterium]